MDLVKTCLGSEVHTSGDSDKCNIILNIYLQMILCDLGV